MLGARGPATLNTNFLSAVPGRSKVRAGVRVDNSGALHHNGAVKHHILVATLSGVMLWLALSGGALAQDAMSSPDDLLAEGWTAYSEELDFEAAMSAYEAVTLHPDATDVQLLEAFEYLAACRFALGDEAGAREALTNLLSINYDQRLTDPSHSPDFLQMLEDIRADMPPPPPEGGMEEPPDDELPPDFGEGGEPGEGEGEGEGTIGDGDDDERRPWYRTWWFWTITGVVVAGAVTAGIVAGTSSGGVADPPQGSLDPGVVQLPCTIRF